MGDTYQVSFAYHSGALEKGQDIRYKIREDTVIYLIYPASVAFLRTLSQGQGL